MIAAVFHSIPYHNLENMVNNTVVKLASEILIKTAHGIVVYNKYLIKNNSNSVDVIKRSTDKVRKFDSSKIALLWVIFDHHGKVNDSANIEYIGKMLAGTKIDIESHRRLIKITNSGSKYIYQCKLQHDLLRQKRFMGELDKYTILAQQLCQQKRTRT